MYIIWRILYGIVIYLPQNRYSNFLRSSLGGRLLGKCEGCVIRIGVRLDRSSKYIFVGSSQLGEYSVLSAREGGEIYIGNNVIMGGRVVFHTLNHNYKNRNALIKEQGTVVKPIKIEDDCWIGSDTIILPGVTIGKGSVIGCGSIVTKDVEPYSVVVGNPARLISKRV